MIPAFEHFLNKLTSHLFIIKQKHGHGNQIICCWVCTSRFQMHQHLYNHILAQHRQIIDNEHGYLTISLQGLIRKKHKGGPVTSEEFTCLHCSEKKPDRRQLRTHIAKVSLYLSR